MSSKSKALVLIGLSFLSLVALADKKQIQVKGSDTEVNIVQMLAENFMKKNKNVSIAVTGGGSGTGIAAILNKSADLANSSRDMKEDELSQAKSNGIDIKRVIFATDALTLVVNESNKAKKLDIETLGKIFRGEIKNWKEIGGDDVAISLYGRQSNSGTYVFFRDQVLKGDYSADMKGMNGNSQIVEAVAQDKGGIGYVGIGYAIDTKTKKTNKGLNIVFISKDKNSVAMNPSDLKAVQKGLYPITRPLYQYFSVMDENLVSFLKYELGPEGRKLVFAEGFYDIKPEWHAENEKTLRGAAQH
jgi:phosphate transport system substrate-binding protein